MSIIKKIAFVSGICAIVYSAFRIEKAAQLWLLPASFLIFCILFSILFWLALWLFSLPIRMDREYEKPSAFYYRLLNVGYRFLCSGARVKIHTTGLEKVPRGRFLLVSNHRSRFDPMVQSIVLKETPLAFISKPSNFTIPIGRRYIKRCCYMAIDRENPRNAINTINRAANLIASDTISVGVYPEGHRGTGTNLQKFKAGCLKTAVKANCPILVTTIWGTDKIHNNFPLRKTDVYFDVLGVIHPQNEKTTALSEKVRAWMQENLDQYTNGERL